MGYTQMGIPFVDGSDTSRAAATSIGSGERAKIRVMQAMRDCGKNGATCEEIELLLGMRHQTTSARIRELTKIGLVVDTGLRRTNTSGCTARVYCAVDGSPVKEDAP